MKRVVVDNSKCIGCGQCESVCSKAFFKEDNREKSAIQVVCKDGVQDINVCVQCGKCIDICPVFAITRDKNGVIRIDKNKCVGCLSCVGFCDYLAMRYHHDYIEPFKCIACGLCVRNCPTGALTLEQ